MGDGGKSGPPKSPPGNAEIFLAFRETTQTTAVRTPRFGLKEEFGLPLATNGNDAETAVKPKETQRLSSRKNRRRRAENLSGTLFGRYVRRFFVDRTTAFNESATRGVQAFLPLAAQIVSSRRNVRALRRIVRKFAPTSGITLERARRRRRPFIRRLFGVCGASGGFARRGAFRSRSRFFAFC